MRALPLLSTEDFEYLGVKHVSQRKLLLEAAKSLKDAPLQQTSRKRSSESMQEATKTNSSQPCREIGIACNSSTAAGAASPLDAAKNRNATRDAYASQGGTPQHTIGLNKPTPSGSAAGLGPCLPQKPSGKAASRTSRQRLKLRRKEVKTPPTTEQPQSREREQPAACGQESSGGCKEETDSARVVVPDSDADSDFQDEAGSRGLACRALVSSRLKPESSTGMRQACAELTVEAAMLAKANLEPETQHCSLLPESAPAEATDKSQTCRAVDALNKKEDLPHIHVCYQPGQLSHPQQTCDASSEEIQQRSSEGKLVALRCSRTDLTSRSRYSRQTEQRLLDALFPKASSSDAWSSDSEDEDMGMKDHTLKTSQQPLGSCRGEGLPSLQ